MKKKLVGLLELETAILECFLEKTPLSLLGVKANNLIGAPSGHIGTSIGTPLWDFGNMTMHSHMIFTEISHIQRCCILHYDYF
jgi:hypothetical protein